MSTIPQAHEWEQIDAGIAECLNCHQSSASIGDEPCFPQISIANSLERVKVRREIDRLARQVEGISQRLYALREQLT